MEGVCNKEILKYSLHICIGLFYITLGINIVDYLFDHIEVCSIIFNHTCIVTESFLLFTSIVNAIEQSNNVIILDLPFIVLEKNSTYHTKIIMNGINTLMHLLKTKRALFQYVNICVDKLFEDIDYKYLQEIHEKTTDDVQSANRQFINTVTVAYQGVVTRSMSQK